MHIHINLDIDNYLQMTIHEETLLVLEATIGFPIHLSYTTGHFEALNRILKCPTTAIHHFIGTLLVIFHYRNIINMGSSPVVRTRSIERGTLLNRKLDCLSL